MKTKNKKQKQTNKKQEKNRTKQNLSVAGYWRGDGVEIKYHT